MRHSWLCFVAVCILAACGPTMRVPTDAFAPGIDPTGQEIDGLIVGQRLMENGEYELALDAFHRAAAKLGLSPEILSAMGVAHFRLGRVDQAQKLFEKALKLEPQWPGLWNNLGMAYMSKGDYAKAAPIFQRAVALDNGENDSLRENLRLALEKREESLYSKEKNNEPYQGTTENASGDDGLFP